MAEDGEKPALYVTTQPIKAVTWMQLAHARSCGFRGWAEVKWKERRDRRKEKKQQAKEAPAQLETLETFAGSWVLQAERARRRELGLNSDDDDDDDDEAAAVRETGESIAGAQVVMDDGKAGRETTRPAEDNAELQDYQPPPKVEEPAKKRKAWMTCAACGGMLEVHSRFLMALVRPRASQTIFAWPQAKEGEAEQVEKAEEAQEPAKKKRSSDACRFGSVQLCIALAGLLHFSPGKKKKAKPEPKKEPKEEAESEDEEEAEEAKARQLGG